jgi:hypothetical protein
MERRSKWAYLTDDIVRIREKHPEMGTWKLARKLIGKEAKNKDVSSLRNFINSLSREGVLSPGDKCSALKSDGSIMTIEEWCQAYGLKYDDTKSWKLVTHTGTPYYNVQSTNISISESKLVEMIVNAIEDRSPNYPKIKRKKQNDPHCLVVDPADVHIGKLCKAMETGEDYDQNIAIQRMRDGVIGVLDKSSGYNIDKIIFIAGNDILHTDTPKRTTTSGTPQDTDGMWYENFVNAQSILIDMIELLMSVADVEVVYNPSNHDYMSGFMLMQAVKAWFRKCKNVKFHDDMSHRKYVTFGKNLIGSTHGDGAKTQDLPMLMAHEASEYWHNCKHRYIYTHHVHHKTSKDFGSVCVESLRSPSGSDSWHHRNGYQHAPKAVEGFIHHPEHGQVARLTNIF